MQMKAIAFPFVVLAVSAGSFHACQPAAPVSSAKTGATPSAGNCGVTVLYQNNGDGEIEPCG